MRLSANPRRLPDCTRLLSRKDTDCLEEKQPGIMPAPETTQNEETKDSSLPKGVVLDKDGKPCRTCTSAASWKALAKQAQLSQSQSQTQSQTQSRDSARSASSSMPIPKSIANAAAGSSSSSSSSIPECPPDVDELGRSTWTFLHSLAATYPTTATHTQQSEMRSFMNLFSKLYPCWVCAEDFRDWMAEPSGRNQPRVGGRKEFGWWMCDAHNEVNRKLGKPEFDCRFWEERWKDGWKDGRCD